MSYYVVIMAIDSSNYAHLPTSISCFFILYEPNRFYRKLLSSSSSDKININVHTGFIMLKLSVST